MIILLRRWNGKYPVWEENRSNFWFDKLENPSSILATWLLSYARLTWGYRSTVGYLGEWSIASESYTYQWKCWTSENFARAAYKKNESLFTIEKQLCQTLSSNMGLELIDIATKIDDIQKDPAGLTIEELDSIIKRKKGE